AETAPEDHGAQRQLERGRKTLLHHLGYGTVPEEAPAEVAVDHTSHVAHVLDEEWLIQTPLVADSLDFGRVTHVFGGEVDRVAGGEAQREENNRADRDQNQRQLDQATQHVGAHAL